MKTLITQLFHIDYPIICSGMTGVSRPELVLAIMLSGVKKSKQLARMANAFTAFQLSMEQGNLEKGIFLMGQVTGTIKDTPIVSDVIKKIVLQAESQKK